MKEETILALMVAPGSRPCLTILKNELDALQKAVSIGAPYQGYIEVLSLEDDVCLICNEEAKLISLPGNRHIGRDIIAGVFYIVGDDRHGNFCSLPMETARRYARIFWEPESFTEKEVCDSMFLTFETDSEP